MENALKRATKKGPARSMAVYTQFPAPFVGAESYDFGVYIGGTPVLRSEAFDALSGKKSASSPDCRFVSNRLCTRFPGMLNHCCKCERET